MLDVMFVWYSHLSHKISALARNRTFLLLRNVKAEFESLKLQFGNAVSVIVEPGIILVLGADVSDIAPFV